MLATSAQLDSVSEKYLEGLLNAENIQFDPCSMFAPQLAEQLSVAAVGRVAEQLTEQLTTNNVPTDIARPEKIERILNAVSATAARDFFQKLDQLQQLNLRINNPFQLILAYRTLTPTFSAEDYLLLFYFLCDAASEKKIDYLFQQIGEESTRTYMTFHVAALIALTQMGYEQVVQASSCSINQAVTVGDFLPEILREMIANLWKYNDRFITNSPPNNMESYYGLLGYAYFSDLILRFVSIDYYKWFMISHAFRGDKDDGWKISTINFRATKQRIVENNLLLSQAYMLKIKGAVKGNVASQTGAIFFDYKVHSRVKIKKMLIDLRLGGKEPPSRKAAEKHYNDYTPDYVGNCLAYLCLLKAPTCQIVASYIDILNDGKSEPADCLLLLNFIKHRIILLDELEYATTDFPRFFSEFYSIAQALQAALAFIKTFTDIYKDSQVWYQTKNQLVSDYQLTLSMIVERLDTMLFGLEEESLSVVNQTTQDALEALIKMSSELYQGCRLLSLFSSRLREDWIVEYIHFRENHILALQNNASNCLEEYFCCLKENEQKKASLEAERYAKELMSDQDVIKNTAKYSSLKKKKSVAKRKKTSEKNGSADDKVKSSEEPPTTVAVSIETGKKITIPDKKKDPKQKPKKKKTKRRREKGYVTKSENVETVGFEFFHCVNDVVQSPEPSEVSVSSTLSTASSVSDGENVFQSNDAEQKNSKPDGEYLSNSYQTNKEKKEAPVSKKKEKEGGCARHKKQGKFSKVRRFFSDAGRAVRNPTEFIREHGLQHSYFFVNSRVASSGERSRLQASTELFPHRAIHIEDLESRAIELIHVHQDENVDLTFKKELAFQYHRFFLNLHDWFYAYYLHKWPQSYAVLNRIYSAKVISENYLDKVEFKPQEQLNQFLNRNHAGIFRYAEDNQEICNGYGSKFCADIFQQFLSTAEKITMQPKYPQKNQSESDYVDNLRLLYQQALHSLTFIDEVLIPRTQLTELFKSFVQQSRQQHETELVALSSSPNRVTLSPQ